MAPFDIRPDYLLLVRVLRTPDLLRQLPPSEFSSVLDAADDARLLGWVVTQCRRLNAPVDPPSWLGDRLTTARALVAEFDRALHWEIDRIDRAFAESTVPWVLLKGAAYLAADLAPGVGRRVADIDILVPHEALRVAEQLLLSARWEFGEIDPYDDRYYREWMHELPPMTHRDRGSVVDVHHAILPRTGRLQPSSSRLFDRAVRVGDGARVLCPAHMVLHAAAHLFHDGEIAGAIRDVADLDGLLRQYSAEAGFWDDLLTEATALDLERPAYYAVHYTREMFATPVPADVVKRLSAWAPSVPVRVLMDGLVTRALPGPAGAASSAAAFALYVRSHWLRMPPLLLAQHLLRKSVMRRH